jgi:hypothetical protein
MGTTPNYAFPYPDAGDAPEVWVDMEELADAIDTKIKSMLDDLAALQPVQASNGDNNGSPTSVTTSTNNGSTVAGVAFVAPPSGRVMIHGNFVFQRGAGTGQLYMGPQVRTGTTVGSGTVVYNPTSDPGAKVGGSGGDVYAGGVSVLVTGLTPGSNYNVSAVFFAISPSSLTINYFSRQVIAQPVH